MHDDEMNYILQDMLVEKFAQKGYRTMAFAYKDISIEAFNGLKKTFNNFETESDREILETQLTFVGLFALEDKLQPDVDLSIQYSQLAAGVNVRLVSGDHLSTAIAYAKQAKIISNSEAKNRSVCMTGEEFRDMAGGLVKGPDGEWVLERKEDFKKVIK
jgi:magnesium-transporting ATPase (P-type)